MLNPFGHSSIARGAADPTAIGRTRVKKLMAVVSILSLALTGSIATAASESEEMVARETAVWTAFRDKNVDQVKKLVSTDVVAIYPDGIYNFDQRMSSMSKIDMKSFSLGNFNVSMVSNDVAIISCKAKVETNDGSSRELNCGTVWNRKKGEWKAIFHSDMRVETAAK
jgi:hypothetical protein